MSPYTPYLNASHIYTHPIHIYIHTPVCLDRSFVTITLQQADISTPNTPSAPFCFVINEGQGGQTRQVCMLLSCYIYIYMLMLLYIEPNTFCQPYILVCNHTFVITNPYSLITHSPRPCPYLHTLSQYNNTPIYYTITPIDPGLPSHHHS